VKEEFITKDDFDIAPMQGRIHYWNIRKQDYGFKKATGKSGLHLSINLDIGIVGELKASKENCDYPRDIISKYVVSNLKE
jgi:hypothetical protein